MLKVLSVFGTRPEAIKLMPVIKLLNAQPHRVVSRVCVTGQHRGLLDQVLNLFDIQPDIDLNLMQHNQTPLQVASAVMRELDPIFKAERPDWMLIQGDTTTVMAAALAGVYCGVKVGHVEAGLRTYDKTQPFPEEINRLVASAVADLHFAPTERARLNLLRENIPTERIVVTGNTIIDALNYVAQQPINPADLPISLSDLENAALRWILVTLHRRENFGQPVLDVCSALRQIVESDSTIRIVFPVHPNPQVQEPVYQALKDVPNVYLLPPLDYFTLVAVMKRVYLILTDSGGIQEEAPGLGKPVLVMREVTERPEAVEAGVARLVGTNADLIVATVQRLLYDAEAYRIMSQGKNPFGDGHAAERIVAALLNPKIS